jgi:hypothetical protein
MCIKAGGDSGDWETAAGTFADYRGGAGTWAAMSLDRRETVIAGLRPDYHEWDAVLNEPTTLDEWGSLLPASTMFAYDPATTRPVLETVELMRGPDRQRRSYGSVDAAGAGNR